MEREESVAYRFLLGSGRTLGSNFSSLSAQLRVSGKSD